MFLTILRLIVVALLALAGLATEDADLPLGEVVTDECSEFDPTCTTPPSELPGPGE